MAENNTETNIYESDNSQYMFGDTLDEAVRQEEEKERTRKIGLARVKQDMMDDVDFFRSQGNNIIDIITHPEYFRIFMTQGKAAVLFVVIMVLFVTLIGLNIAGIVPKIIVRAATVIFVAITAIVYFIKTPRT